MTYKQLLKVLKKMSDSQLEETVQAYSGDIDDTMRVIGTSVNTNEEMGESLVGFSTTQLFLILE